MVFIFIEGHQESSVEKTSGLGIWDILFVCVISGNNIFSKKKMK